MMLVSYVFLQMVLLLTTVNNKLARGDLFHHMEDAFADEVDLKGE